jgi:glycosyltransferase involved in cell wall biosynthesis
LSTLHGIAQGYEVVLLFIAGDSPLSFIPRLAGQKVALNVDGLDWKRQKWPGAAKTYIRLAESLATRLPNAVITDSRAVQSYYRERYGAETSFIPYGADVTPLPPGGWLERYGLTPRQYILFVGRLVPENCAHQLVQAMSGVKTDMKCVIVGDAPYAEEYQRALRASARANVIFTGYVFGEGYRELSSHPYLFVETSEVGGTHPALVEAMGFGNAVIANGTPENRETMGEAGMAYDGTVESLTGVLQALVDNPDRVEEYRRKGCERAREKYSWEAVTDEYEGLFRRLVAGKARAGNF